MKYYHGAVKKGPFFEGWYLKYKSREGKAIALIPALHIDSRGQCSASLQIITESKTWWLEYPYSEFHAEETQFRVFLGKNIFSEKGAWLDIEQDGLSLHGSIQHGPFSALKSDIMGPFSFLADMECSHGVISMYHSLQGELRLNDELMDFSDGTGYIETDRGRSFPSAYLWTQCSWQGRQCNSLMLSIASIPFAWLNFTGCICAVIYNGREYRLATYLGGKAEQWSNNGAVIRQGKYRLEVKLLEQQAQPLRAPLRGNMERVIHESLCSKVSYHFFVDDKLLFEHEDKSAGFEYSDMRAGLRK